MQSWKFYTFFIMFCCCCRCLPLGRCQMCPLHHLLLLVYFTWCLSCQFALFLALTKHKFLMVSLSSNSICTFNVYKKNAALVFAESVIVPSLARCHEIELTLEWMLHDLSTLTSPDEWSEKNEEIWKETRVRKKEGWENLIARVSEKCQIN